MKATNRKIIKLKLIILSQTVMFLLRNNCSNAINTSKEIRLSLNNALEAKESAVENIDLLKVLQRLKSEHEFRTLFVLRKYSYDCSDWSYLKRLNVPLLLLDLKQNLYIKNIFNSDLLTLVCLIGDLDEALIEKLAENLQHIRNSRILFVWNQENMDYYQRTMAINQLVTLCKIHEMPRILIIFHDFNRTASYYTYQQFPALTIETHSFLNSTTNIFSTSTKNLHRQPLRTASDWSQPSIINYVNEKGQINIAGYLAVLATTFVQKLNASLRFPTYNSTVLYYNDLLIMTRNNTIDFALSLSTPKIELNPEEYTYPIIIGDWSPMIPVEPKLQIGQLYLYILNFLPVCLIGVLMIILSAIDTISSSKWWSEKSSRTQKWVQLLINNRSLRAMLGQPFPLYDRNLFKQRLSLALLLLAGFLISNIYTVTLSSHITNPPAAYKISSFDDLLHKPPKIMITEKMKQQFILLKGQQFWDKYEKCFIIEPSIKRLKALRDSLNTTFGYAVTSFVWSTLDEQQKHYGQQLFRIEPNIFFDDFYTASMPIRANSIFKNDFDIFILEMEASGLLAHWKALTYGEMLKIGIFPKRTPSHPDHQVPIGSGDLYGIWLAFWVMHLMALIVFVMEMAIFKLRSQ